MILNYSTAQEIQNQCLDTTDKESQSAQEEILYKKIPEFIVDKEKRHKKPLQIII